MAPLKIDYLAVDNLRPYERNARTHSAEQVSQIAESIRAFGWTNPILIDEDNEIIAGHGRLAAALEIGLAEVPVIRLEGLTVPQKRALALADNKLALNAGWDEKLLAAELEGLDAQLRAAVGFSADELVRLMGGHEGLTDPDEVPPVPADPVTRYGDLWQLGPHRLLCGDATCAADVAEALDGVVPNLMVTDPPYGVEYDADWRNHTFRADGSLIAGRAIGRVSNDDRVDWHEAFDLFGGQVAYCWHADRHASTVQQSLEASGFTIRCQIIWAKTRFVISRGDYHWQHEPCWYAVRKKGDWHGDRSQSTLWAIDHQKSETGHSAQKPVECMRRPIENNSLAGQAVYDPFLGSGTTLIAAEMMARVCHALEINPAYCDCAVTRWENFTGRKATRVPARADAA